MADRQAEERERKNVRLRCRERRERDDKIQCRFNKNIELDEVMHAFNFSTQEAKVGRYL